MRVRFPILLAASAMLIAVPAASARSGTVLSVDAQQHTVQVISGTRVHGYRYRSGAALATGRRVRFDVSGGRLRAIALASNARAFSFVATVVGAGDSGLVLQLQDRGIVKFSSRAVKRACPSVVRVASGEKLHVLERRSGAGYRLILRAASGKAVCASATGGSAADGPAPAAGGVERAAGTVTAVDAGDVVVSQPGGATLTLNAPPDAIDFLSSSTAIGLAPCETVSVSYQPSSAGLMLDGLAVTGQSVLGCEEGDGVSLLVAGVLQNIGSSTFTVGVPSLGALTIGQGNPSAPATDGLDIGDGVLVAYVVNGDGSLLATDAGEDLLYTTGTVTSVAPDGIVVRDWTTGASETFLSDLADFSSVRSGDAVGLAYHTSAAGLQGESVDDLTTGTSG